MSRDDPFAEPSDTEKTVIKPNPGGRRTVETSAEAAPPPRQAAPAGVAVDPSMGATGMNALNAAAAPIFALVARIRNRAQHNNPDALREAVVREIQQFEQRALHAGQPVQSVRVARYALCATIDDVVLNTPWGGRSSWTQKSMVGTFHKETHGGERFFDLLSRLEQEPGANRELLEFLYVCLSLGFEGRLRVENRGIDKHTSIRDGLARLIRAQRGPVEHDLSPHWRGLKLPHKPLSAWASIWVITGLTVTLLGLGFAGFSYALSGDTGRLQGQIAALDLGGVVSLKRAAPPPPPPPPPPPEVAAEQPFERLKTFLAPEIEQGLVAVFEDANTVTVRIRGQGLFGSGSDELTEQFEPVVIRVGDALNEETGNAIIAGHSDNVPIRSARFPSNLHLSLARAESVMRTIAKSLDDPGRLTAEGRADKEPIAPNSTPEGRALNRRIEVILVKSN